MFIKTYNVNDRNVDAFNEDVKKGTAMVAYTADWCGHCQNLKPHWNQFQNSCSRKKCRKPVTVASCDVPQNQGKAFYADNVRGFPTIVAFKNGKLKKTFSPVDGNRENPKDLEKFLKSVMGASSKKSKKTKKKKGRRKTNKKNSKSKKKKKRRRKKISRKKFKKLAKMLGY
jgi:thiol-disulfide isomerase/thioredoxin